jgi:hypothetical protein
MTGLKEEERVRGGESVIASRSNRETIQQKREAFLLNRGDGDSVPFHGPAAREYAHPTSVCGPS